MIIVGASHVWKKTWLLSLHNENSYEMNRKSETDITQATPTAPSHTHLAYPHSQVLPMYGNGTKTLSHYVTARDQPQL